MARYRFTIRRTEVWHEVVECDAARLSVAAVKAQQYADETRGSRRGTSVVQRFEDDPNTTLDREVVGVKQV